MLHQTMTNKMGISLRVTFEYDPDQRASVLGEGAFGTVYAVKSTLDGKPYAFALKVSDGDGESDGVSSRVNFQRDNSFAHIEFMVDTDGLSAT